MGLLPGGRRGVEVNDLIEYLGPSITISSSQIAGDGD
jgi:hypothetical protein